MTTAILRPRDYQDQCKTAFQTGWDDGLNNTVAVLPTGAGKTIVFSHVARDFFERTGKRVLIEVHTDELAQQAYQKMRAVAPRLRVGIVKAWRNDVKADIVIGSVATLRNAKRLAQLQDVGLGITDECFPAGTLVGGRPIESLVAGDVVPSWDEYTGQETWQPVTMTMSKRPESLVRVLLDGVDPVVCTANHPILTEYGWCPAGMLPRGVHVVSFTHDSTASRDLYGVHQTVHPDSQEKDRRLSPVGSDLLLRSVPGYLGGERRLGAHVSDQSQVRISTNGSQQPHDQARDQGQDVRDLEKDQAQAAHPGWQRQASGQAAATVSGLPGLAYRSSDRTQGRGASLPLSGGHRAPDDESLRRGGWRIPLLAGPPRIRPTQGRKAVLTRVVGVQVLQPGCDGTYGGLCPDGLVYNLSVAGTHIYQVGDGLVVHNCHHATAAGYRRIRAAYPDALWCGVTATLIRGDGKGLGTVWDGGVVYRKSIGWMIRHGLGDDGYTSIPVLPGYGYLLDVRGKRIEVDDLDLSGVKRSGGDFQNASLGRELSRSMAPETAARAYLEHASDRSAVAFWPTVDSAYEFADAAAALGVKVETVHGELGTEERRAILRRLHNGTIQMVSNCMVLTEGFDSPRVNCIMIGRATKSPGLYQQMVGRGLRPFTDPATGEAQRDCLILDVVGASAEHGLASLVDLSEDITRRPRDGQSLAEAEDEEAALEAEQDEQGRIVLPDYRYRGQTVAVDFDPLARASKLTWCATTGGTWFLSAGDFYVFVMPSVTSGALDGTYDVLWTRKDRKFEHTYDGVTGFWGFTSHTAIPLDYAFAWGEEVAAELGGDPFALLTRKDKRWRKSEPTDAQRDACRRRGLTVPDDANRGDVSILLDTWTASQMIDPAVAYFQAQKAANEEMELVNI